jgi:hypothetical protein
VREQDEQHEAPRVPLQEVVKTGLQRLSAFPLVKSGGTNYSTDAALDEAAPEWYARPGR